MKSLLLLVGLSCSALLMHAQDVTYKKGSFKADKEEVAKVDDKRYMLIYKNFFVTNKAGKELVTFKVHTQSNVTAFNEDAWYEVEFPTVGKKATRNVPVTLLGSAEKELMPDLADMKIIKADGSVNPDGVEQYLKKFNENLEVKARAKADSLADLVARGGKFGNLPKGRIKVGYDKTITLDGKTVGTWKKNGKDPDADYWVFNQDGGLECIIRKSKGIEAKVEVLTWDSSKSRHNNDGNFYHISFGDSDTGLILGVVNKMAYR